MKYLLSVVLLFVKMVCCESGASPLYILTKKTTSTQVIRNSTVKRDTRAYFQPQRRFNSENPSSVLNIIDIHRSDDDENLKDTTPSKEVHYFVKMDKQYLKVKDRYYNASKIQQSNELNILTKEITLPNKTLKLPSENSRLRAVRQIVNDAKRLIAKLKISKGFEKKVDNDTNDVQKITNKNLQLNKGAKGSSLSVINNKKSELTESALPLQAPKKDPAQHKTYSKNNNLKYTNKNNIQVLNQNNLQFHNQKKPKTMIKIRNGTANASPVFTKGYPKKLNLFTYHANVRNGQFKLRKTKRNAEELESQNEAQSNLQREIDNLFKKGLLVGGIKAYNAYNYDAVTDNQIVSHQYDDSDYEKVTFSPVSAFDGCPLKYGTLLCSLSSNYLDNTVL